MKKKKLHLKLALICFSLLTDMSKVQENILLTLILMKILSKTFAKTVPDLKRVDLFFLDNELI